jgi:hypothetical protein
MAAFFRGHRNNQMKEANNNEVDLLLRSFARERSQSRPQSGSAGDGARVFSDHLDADELNSYAEGVVPAAARARYTAHLADCDACRGVVIGLTQATGAANRYEVSEPQGGLSFWQKLAALFSPGVLRYAVPVLVLTAAIGLGLLALRQQRRTEFLAKDERVITQAPETETSSSLKPTEPPPTNQNGAAPRADTESTRERSKLQDQTTKIGQEPLVAESSGQKAPGKDAGEPAAGAGRGVEELRPSYAPEPKKEAPAPPVARDAEKSAELAKVQTANREDQDRARNEYKSQPTDEVHGPSRSSNNAALPGSQRSAGLMGARGPSVNKNKNTAEVGTRTVSGRRFVREEDAWVDTAYESSRATTRVARGSDQFRALVADEPGIRAIAEQLNGVVIVVWKNRAYRIQ